MKFVGPRNFVGRGFGGRLGLPGAGRSCLKWTRFTVVFGGLPDGPLVGSYIRVLIGDGK